MKRHDQRIADAMNNLYEAQETLHRALEDDLSLEERNKLQGVVDYTSVALTSVSVYFSGLVLNYLKHTQTEHEEENNNGVV